MSIYEEDGRWNVKKFCLDDEIDKKSYEKILNSPSCTIKRDEVYHSKTGQTFITI